LLLLGFATLGLAAAASDRWGPGAVPGRRWLVLAANALLLSLLPLTAPWPAAWGGVWTLHLAAWVALAPVLVALLMIGRQLAARRARPPYFGSQIRHPAR
jgi:hypothetical protein